jgi:uncharacterized damage-inducible protein DinB
LAQALRATRPEQTEFLPYYGKYIDRVGKGDIIDTLTQQMKETQSLLRSIAPAMATHRYAPDKWSISEVIGHVIDAERIFATRALRFARADEQPLPGFEQDDYVKTAKSNAYPLGELASELDALRQANIFFFKHLPGEAWMRKGIASGAEVTVRALAYIIAGHELHHRQLLRTRYLVDA